METITEKAIQDTSLSKIMDTVVTEYHDYFKYNLPVISTILNSAMMFDKKIVKNLVPTCKYFEEFKELLEQHTSREKYILFPVLQKISSGGELNLKDDELRKMDHEIRNDITKLFKYLKQLNRLTSNYKPANNASQSLKQCYWDLHMLEQNCNRYFEIEKKYLLPKLITYKNS